MVSKGYIKVKCIQKDSPNMWWRSQGSSRRSKTSSVFNWTYMLLLFKTNSKLPYEKFCCLSFVKVDQPKKWLWQWFNIFNIWLCLFLFASTFPGQSFYTNANAKKRHTVQYCHLNKKRSLHHDFYYLWQDKNNQIHIKIVWSPAKCFTVS